MSDSHSVVSHSFRPHAGTLPCQAPLYMEFSRQEYWIGLPFPSPITVRFWTKPDFPKLNLEMVDFKKIYFSVNQGNCKQAAIIWGQQHQLKNRSVQVQSAVGKDFCDTSNQGRVTTLSDFC